MNKPLNVFYLFRADDPGARKPTKLTERILPEICGYLSGQDATRPVRVFAQINRGGGKADRFVVPPHVEIPDVNSLESLYEELRKAGANITEVDLPGYEGGGEIIEDFVEGYATEAKFEQADNVLVLAGHGASTSSMVLLKMLQQLSLFDPSGSVSDFVSAMSGSLVPGETDMWRELGERLKKLHDLHVENERYLYTRSVAEALQGKIKFNLIWTHACGMATLESAYDLENVTDYYIASPFDIRAQGNHRSWIRQVGEHPVTGLEFARTTACYFYESVSKTLPTVCVDFTDFARIRQEFGDVVNTILGWLNGGQGETAIAALVCAATRFECATRTTYDVYFFFDSLASDFRTPNEVSRACHAFCDALAERTTIFGRETYESSTNPCTYRCGGVSFYLPFVHQPPHQLAGSHVRTSALQWKSKLITETDWPQILERLHAEVSDTQRDSQAISLL
ncbi:MAG: clostripain-related cysteine peptidase [Rubinisphaera brasiliensis]|uniref:clostripain-related cysteine peptidase n=1 Tax=Rubinisphaera brasiliensis TaxID=119 RepID=UPI00391AD103